MSVEIKSPKKLIEVALPLDKINAAAREEKAVPRRGHPQTLHYWWARRPQAAARAVIFAQLVNDPSWKWELENPGKTAPNHLKATWAVSRKRLFKIIEDFTRWDNRNNEKIFEIATAEIMKSWNETCELNKDHPSAGTLFNKNNLPGLHDPFSGGGTIPLEAQRLGLSAYASDLNPVAVLISKALIEIPPAYSGKAPVNPNFKNEQTLAPRKWKGAEGLADDVRYYGNRILEEARSRIGHQYPKVKVTEELIKQRPDLLPYLGKELATLAYFWAKTVRSPNPAFRDVDVPLISSFVLGSNAGKETYIEPIKEAGGYRFAIKFGKPPVGANAGTTAGKRSGFICLMSGSPIDYDYIRTEGQAGRIGQKLMAVVAEGDGSRIYLAPSEEIENAAKSSLRPYAPNLELSGKCKVNVSNYGLEDFSDLFTSRQKATLGKFCDLITDIRSEIQRDEASDASSEIDAKRYAEGISVYLACALSRLVTYNNSNCYWNIKGGSVGQIFARQAISMMWDFIEINPLEKMSGNWSGAIDWVSEVLDGLNSQIAGVSVQEDAQSQTISVNKFICTDPPYYDNIAYADLSDFFYMWLREALRPVMPELFATVAVPKVAELVATPSRHGGKEAAEEFFLQGMTSAMSSISQQAHPGAPVSIFYAFKQTETHKTNGTGSTGWETFLEAVIRSGFVITGTWPMRTERDSGVKAGSNVLASSIVLICRKRSGDAASISRRGFIRELNSALPEALDGMTRGATQDTSPVAPVDLSQAIIGPGMAIFSKYSAVLEADGSSMTVQTALRLINRFLADDDFDADTQFCLQWFDQHGWKPGNFGDADQLARAKGTAVNGVQQAGVIVASGGSVQLVRWADYPHQWDPATDTRLPVWEVLHQLIRIFKDSGESGAATILSAVSSKADGARQLAYRLYTLCERSGWSDDARAYNEIITSWTAIEDAAARVPKPRQATLFDA